MGFFDSSSSSSSSTVNNTTNVDKRLVTDNGSMGISSDSSTFNISSLDGGSVKAALAANSANFTTLMDTVKVLGGGAVNALAANVSLAKDLSSTTQAAYSDATGQATGNKTLLYGVMAVIGLIAVSMMIKKAG